MPRSSVRALRNARAGAATGRLKPLIIATCNAGKLREFQELFAGLPFEVVAQGVLGIESAEETGKSFVENALLKARHASAAAGMAAIADDSGLEVDALGGAPGIFSARYAGPLADDDANNAKLRDALEAYPPPWTARYRCALVFVDCSDAPHAAPIIAESSWEGLILSSPRGSLGFGYDPYFWLPDIGLTAAELDPLEKNQLSHRGKAMRELKRLLGLQPWAAAGR